MDTPHSTMSSFAFVRIIYGMFMSIVEFLTENYRYDTN